MAVIEKIRQRSGLLILLIGFALLSFLVSDAISNNLGLFRGNNTVVGEIDGKEIDYQDFNKKFEVYKGNMEQRGQVVDELTSNMIRDQIWNEYIQTLVINDEYEKLGLAVSGTELFASVTNPVDIPQLRDEPSFKNETTGQFDRNKMIQYLKGLDNNAEAKRQWVNFEETSIKPQLIAKKYNLLVSKGIYRTSLEVKADYDANNTQVDGKVVGFNFNSIQDDSVQVTEEEMREYLNSHKADYQQEASRRFEYVVFDVFPSQEDTASVRDWAMKKVEEFRNAKNDTLFIESNSMDGFDTTYKPRGTWVDRIDEAIFNGNPGEVVGPYYEGGEYAMYKILGFEEDTVPYIRASQILLKPRGGYAKEDSLNAMERANKIAAALRNGADFVKMAEDSSQDYRTAAKGGDLGWMKKGNGTVPEAVEKVLYSSPEGSIFVVRSQQGAHVVKVTGPKTTRKACVGKVGRRIEYSSATDRAVYDKAYDFVSNARDQEGFNAKSESLGLNKRISPDIKENDAQLPEMPDARNLIRWAFNEDTEIGDVSDIIELNNRYVVAILVNTKEEGTAKLEDVRDQLEADTRNAKKAEILKKRLSAAMGGGKTIEQIALEVGAIVSNVPNVSLGNPNLAYVGNDPALAGAMVGSKQDQLSGPIETKNGVYIYIVTARREAGEPQNLMAERGRLMQETSGQASSRAFEALKKAADIEDYRFRFF